MHIKRGDCALVEWQGVRTWNFLATIPLREQREHSFLLESTVNAALHRLLQDHGGAVRPKVVGELLHFFPVKIRTCVGLLVYINADCGHNTRRGENAEILEVRHWTRGHKWQQKYLRITNVLPCLCMEKSHKVIYRFTGLPLTNISIEV